MFLPDQRRLRLIVGLLAVLLFFSIYNLYLDEAHFFEVTTRATRHIIKFLSVLLVYGIGVFAFAGNSRGWVLQLWHIGYAAILLLLILLGLYDSWTGGFSQQVRTLTVTLFEFLVSPIPFVVVAIIDRSARVS